MDNEEASSLSSRCSSWLVAWCALAGMATTLVVIQAHQTCTDHAAPHTTCHDGHDSLYLERNMHLQGIIKKKLPKSIADSTNLALKPKRCKTDELVTIKKEPIDKDDLAEIIGIKVEPL